LPINVTYAFGYIQTPDGRAASPKLCETFLTGSSWSGGSALILGKGLSTATTDIGEITAEEIWIATPQAGGGYTVTEKTLPYGSTTDPSTIVP
jgi:hypothetical protein